MLIIEKASLELIRKFISEEEEQILLEKYGIEFVSYDEYEILDELIEAWKKGVLDLETSFVFHEDNPVFNPLKKYFYTYLRDKILQTKYPDFSEDIVVLDERTYYEKVILESIFDSSKNAFFIDTDNPYLYNFAEDKTSENIKTYLSDLSERNSVFLDETNSLSKADVSRIWEEVKNKKSKKMFIQDGDEYFSLDETKWLSEAKRIFSIVFNSYINASYAKSKEKTDDEKEFLEITRKL